jgi:hypothetical protein
MFAAACAGPSHDVSRRSPAMVLLDRAKNVEYGLAGAEESVAYDVAPPLALDAARQRIDAALRKDGWKAVTNQAPFHYVDARGTREPIDSWRGTWQRGGNTVEYIVQRHPDFLHVWAGLAPSSQSASHGAAPAQPAPPAPAVEQPASIEAGANDVVILCGDRGAVAVAAVLTGPSSATVEWRTAERSGRTTAAERAGARPHEIDAGAAHVAAGPYDVLWSPAEVRMSGSRDAPQTLLGGTSRLSFAPSIKAHRMTGAKLGAVRLDDACR